MILKRCSLSAGGPIVLMALAATGCGGAAPPHPAVGRTLGGLPIAPVADSAAAAPRLGGKVTLLNLWGTWCPPCRAELPGLVRLAGRLADDPRFQLVAISSNPAADDFPDVAAETRAFLAQERINLEAWACVDPVGRDMLFSTIGLEGFPTTALVGPDARIRRVWVGYRPHYEAEIAAAVVSLLAELPAAR